MNWRWQAYSVLAIGMAVGSAQAAAQAGPPPPPPQGHVQGEDTPPPGYSAVERRGFEDGMEGARRDFENRRQPNVNNRDEYRNPSFIPAPDRRAYRAAFLRGYNVGVRRYFGRR